MSDIGFSYKCTVKPSNLDARFGLSFAGATLRATVRSLDDFVLVLEPTGNISEEILSGVAWPTAQTITAALSPLIKQMVLGETFNVLTVLPSSVKIEGEQVTVQPDGNLQIATVDGMLMVTGNLLVS